MILHDNDDALFGPFLWVALILIAVLFFWAALGD